MINYQDNHTTLYNMNFMDNDLPDESVQMVVTSPPYWGLRRYSGEQDLIWGNQECEYEWEIEKGTKNIGRDDKYYGGVVGATLLSGVEQKHPENSSFCSLCGAWRGAYGLEPTPEMYVQHTIEILREVRRVLRKDGVCFINIGDSYASGKGTCFNPGGGDNSLEGHAKLKDERAYPLDRGNKSTLEQSHLKPKDLCLIPFRVALEAQADGWWVRSVIIWSKPNPMPESVTDRPTESHEYILMLTKSAKYYWDADAVREQSISTDFGSDQRDTSITHGIGGGNSGINAAKKRAREAGTFGGRNIRSVWEFPTQPYPEAHFAVFPEKLPELCIKAATPEVGCCTKCGSPWERVTDRNPVELRPNSGSIRGRSPSSRAYMGQPQRGSMAVNTQTIGWQPTCKCNADKVPSTILDPFAGAGTSLWVAKKLNRRAIGFELSDEYCQLIVERIRQQVLL